MANPIIEYFSEFRILRTASKDFWLINAIQFFDGLAYFSMMNVLVLFLTKNCGFTDFDSGKWIGIYTLLITAFVFGVGAVCDTIGLKRSFFIGMTLTCLARLSFGIAPMFLKEAPLQYAIIAMMIAMSFGVAFMGPVMTTALRRFTSKENRSTGFNIYYLIMNVGAIFANMVMTDLLRNVFGDINGNLAIMIFGFFMSLCSLGCLAFINEHNYCDPSEKIEAKSGKRPLAIFLEVWKERAFQKLVLFLVLTIGVRLVFTHQFLVMPKYYTRVLQSDFALGFANGINPLIIVIGLIALIPIINRYDTFKLIVLGMAVSAFSLVFLAMPIGWALAIPGIHNLDQAYTFVIFAQITVFAVGELIFSPRFTEYISIVAPKDKVASYMSLSALPTFISKPLNGFLSGVLVATFSYEGIRAKIDAGAVSYRQSPEFMWLVYLGLAVLSPVAVILMKNTLKQQHPATVHPTWTQPDVCQPDGNPLNPDRPDEPGVTEVKS